MDPRTNPLARWLDDPRFVDPTSSWAQRFLMVGLAQASSYVQPPGLDREGRVGAVLKEPAAPGRPAREVRVGFRVNDYGEVGFGGLGGRLGDGRERFGGLEGRLGGGRERFRAT